MAEEVLIKDMQACQENDISKIPIVNEENSSMLNEIERSPALEFEQEAKERLRKLAKLAANVNVRFYRNLHILKAYEKKDRMNEYMWRVTMRIIGQCTRDLHNLHKECTKFRNYMGKADGGMCANNDMFKAFIIFTNQAQPAMFKWQGMTKKIMKNVKQLKLIRKKYNIS